MISQQMISENIKMIQSFRSPSRSHTHKSPSLPVCLCRTSEESFIATQR